MPIYDKSTRELFNDFIDNFTIPKQRGFFQTRKEIKEGGYFSRQEVLSWFNTKYPKIKKGTINAHLILSSTNARSRVHHNARPNRDIDLFFQIDGSNFRLYDKTKDPQPIYKEVVENLNGNKQSEEEDEGQIESKEFAYEKDLRNYLSKNLNEIESGLKLYEEEEITVIEFPVGGRFIDILAVDKNNDFVVIELKISKGYDRAIGQLLRYIGWIEENLAESNQSVRGIIIASNISEDLLLATKRLPGFALYEYEMSFSLKKIKT